MKIFRFGAAPLKNDRKAQSLVEFALILPIFLALLMAIFEFGLLLKNYLGMNYALGRAAHEASLCRGIINPDLKVITRFLENAVMINSNFVYFISPAGTAYGPYKLKSGSVYDAKTDAKVASLPEELFFYKDNGTPVDLSDDTVATSLTMPAANYAKIKVRYTHTFINALILGLGDKGAMNIELSMRANVAPAEE